MIILFYHHSFKANVNYKNHRGFEKNLLFVQIIMALDTKCDKKSDKEFDIGFLGDSFVEGTSENFEDTFVGIFSSAKKI